MHVADESREDATANEILQADAVHTIAFSFDCI